MFHFRAVLRFLMLAVRLLPIDICMQQNCFLFSKEKGGLPTYYHTQEKIMQFTQSIVIERLQQAQNAQDLEALLACFVPNFQGSHPLHPERGFQGIEDARKNWFGIFHSIPDFHSELLRLTVEGDTAWVEWYWFGTHLDGTQFGMRGVTILGIQADQIEWARLYMEPVSASSE